MAPPKKKKRAADKKNNDDANATTTTKKEDDDDDEPLTYFKRWCEERGIVFHPSLELRNVVAGGAPPPIIDAASPTTKTKTKTKTTAPAAATGAGAKKVKVKRIPPHQALYPNPLADIAEGGSGSFEAEVTQSQDNVASAFETEAACTK